MNREPRSLIDVWKMVEERRREHYNHKGVLYFERDEDGIVQERYFGSFSLYEKAYPTFNRDRHALMIDLSREKEN